MLPLAATFRSLHQSDSLFILPNAWDVKSAQLFQEHQFAAVGTSSAAVANSLGYQDGEDMPFEDYLFVIKRIQAAIQIPLTVDMEMGYGNTPEAIYANILQLINLGVAGINIEDSSVISAVRILKNAGTFAGTIAYIKNRLAAEGLDLFITIRCDTYLLNVPGKQDETNRRLQLYQTTGADAIFLPCISEPADIAAAVQNTSLPINVMCVPGLPGFEALQQLGVKRASMGPFLFSKTYQTATALAQAIVSAQSFSPLFS
ncbi:isocitrate lyase/PEP mutase family protein [Deminuibacter soli]|uniref:Isocitrate lyase/phosphoenolpyruvate mutase family protein n=1 Tax=Deminuibacter soli TaxID=2291815 RepID=A0A3E1NLB8_9BACT|nr:isocitrate lyase/phosphoenolpyruvate mutase family protein [Deminuibacter soli]RFM28712.1 isocitrate lyase/phosphoenolpyruvate mutase family protein [Deminuibacter soli]